MEKKSLFSTKTMVATALGAALFFVLFAYVKIPSQLPVGLWCLCILWMLVWSSCFMLDCCNWSYTQRLYLLWFTMVELGCSICSIRTCCWFCILLHKAWWRWIQQKDYPGNYRYQRDWKCHCMGACSSMLRYCYLCWTCKESIPAGFNELRCGWNFFYRRMPAVSCSIF